MNTWQIVLTIWLAYGVGVITGIYTKNMFDDAEELTSELIDEGDKK